ncbi:MAG TPA: phosphoglycerate mutase [Clostridiales bacterium]|nr:phosphoglycerate mutase [Clostridiales bacterium]
MIYIIRHGQTDWNIERRTQGHTDIALNINGIKLAELMAQKIANLKIDSIISSDLKRAYMTAQIINKKFNKNIETDKRLREFSFGTLEGITREKITPEIWDDFNKNPKKFNAEKREEIFNRIKSFINDIKSNDKNILVVTHGGPIRMIKYYLENGESFNDKKYLAEYMTIKINNLDLFIIDEEMNLIKNNL